MRRTGSFIARGSMLVVIVSIAMSGCRSGQVAGPPSAGIAERVEASIGRDAPFHLIVSIAMDPAWVERFTPIAIAAEQGTAAEPGNIYYRFVADNEKPGHFELQEAWRDLGSLEWHLEQHYVQNLLAFIGESQSTVDVRVMTPLSGG